MLQSLQIKNLALVDALNVEFESGLNVITGETGAGKSLIIGALNLLLGERADKTLLRAGADQCVVEAVFQMAWPDELRALLQAGGIECDAEDRLIGFNVVAGGGLSCVAGSAKRDDPGPASPRPATGFRCRNRSRVHRFRVHGFRLRRICLWHDNAERIRG